MIEDLLPHPRLLPLGGGGRTFITLNYFLTAILNSIQNPLVSAC